MNKENDIYIEAQVNDSYKNLASEVVASSIIDFNKCFRHYLMTGKMDMRGSGISHGTIFLKDCVNFILSESFILYSSSNINPEALLKNLTIKVGKDVLKNNPKDRDLIVSRYDVFRRKLEKAFKIRKIFIKANKL